MTTLIEKIISSASRRKAVWITAVLLCAVLSAVVFFRAELTNEIRHLFPASGETGTTFRVLEKSHLADLVQLEFISSTPGGIGQYADWLEGAADRLKTVPGIRNVVYRYRTGSGMDGLEDLTRLIPLTQTPDALKKCDPDEAAKNALSQLSMPFCNVKLLRNSPFSALSVTVFNDLNRLNHLGGLRLAHDTGTFADVSKTRAMILFEAGIAIGDADAVRTLYRQIGETVGTLPDGLSMRIISGCNHTLGNEQVLKRDAAVAGVLSVILFLLLFLLFFRRDPRALWIPAVPLFASLLALGIVSLCFDTVCLYVIGLGGCITGLAVDQGIHIYAACRKKDPFRNAAGMAVPMMLSSATSVLVFLFLGLSGITAYEQLAVFAGLTLIFSCLAALFLLPGLLSGGGDDAGTLRLPEIGKSESRRTKAVGIVLVLAAGALIALPHLNIDLSAESLDGTPDEIIAAEKDFNAVWRDPEVKTAVIAAAGKDQEEAQQRLEKLCEYLGDSAVLPPLPSRKKAAEHLAMWRTPSTAARLDTLEKDVKAACAARKLPEQFFAPFFESLRSVDHTYKPGGLAAYIHSKMVKDHSAVALMEETPENIQRVREVLRDHGGGECAVISREAFRQQVVSDFSGRFLLLLCLSLGGSFLLALAVFRNLNDVILAMVPVGAAFAFLLIFFAVTGLHISAAAGFAFVLLAGLAIDYGVYSVHLLQHPGKGSIRSSVLLSAATTAAGAGALIFSRHPVLFDTGIVLSLGVTAACICGLWLVPLLKEIKGGNVVTALLCCFLLASCTTYVPLTELPQRSTVETAVRSCSPATGKIRLHANAVWQIFGNRIPAILAAEIDCRTGSVRCSGITSAGTRLFQITEQTGYVPGAGVPESAAGLFEQMPSVLRNIFLLKTENAFAAAEGTEYIALKTPDDVRWEFRNGMLTRRRSGIVPPFRNWDCSYRPDGSVEYRDHERFYILELTSVRIKNTESGK